jgi:hypothetical protein
MERPREDLLDLGVRDKARLGVTRGKWAERLEEYIYIYLHIYLILSTKDGNVVGNGCWTHIFRAAERPKRVEKGELMAEARKLPVDHG